MTTRDVVSSTAYLETTDARLNCNCMHNAIAVLLSPSANYPDHQYIISKTDIVANRVNILPARKETFSGYNFYRVTNTLSLIGETISADGNAVVAISFTGNYYSFSKSVEVALLTGDTPAQAAEKIRLALIYDSEVGNPDTGFFTISGSGSSIILTSNYIDVFMDTSGFVTITGGPVGLFPTSASDTILGTGISVDAQDDYYTLQPINGGWAVVDKHDNKLSTATITDTVTAGQALEFASNNVGATYTVTGQRPFLGANASTFNADNSIVIRRNGVDQVKGTDVIWYDSLRITFADNLDAGETITINS